MKVSLRGPDGNPVEVDVLDVHAAAGERRVETTVEVTPDVWTHIDGAGLFHLEPAARRPGAIEGSTPVRLDLRLTDELAGQVGDELAAASDPVADVVRRMEAEAPEGLLDCESWYALRATEALDIPEDLAGPGVELRSGFTTVWDAEMGDAQEAEVAQTMDTADVVRAVLAEHEFQPRESEGPTFEVDGHGAEGEWTLRIHVVDEEARVIALSIWPGLVPEDRRGDLTELVTRVNVRLRAGAFVLDLDSGNLAFRNSLRTVDGPPTAAAFADLVADNLSTMDDAYPAIRAAVEEGEGAQSALARLERT